MKAYKARRKGFTAAYIPFIAVFLIVIFLSNCNTTEPTKQKLELGFEDASCTEVWLKLTGETGTELTLTRDDKEVEKFTLTTSPQTIRDDSLNPNTTYKYKITGDGETSAAEAATLDTTGNSFTWRTWNFGGDIGSCDLYDAAIINENDIWAVGEILMPDTNENGYTTYNAVHWDGSEWESKRIKTNACGGVEYPPIEAIFAFSSNDILFAHKDGSITHYNGIEYLNDCTLITQLNGSANKIWGMSRNDFYVVSGDGFIAHYQNGVWTKIETGTDLQFYDIYGSENSETGKLEILALCSRNYPSGNGLYRIEGNTAKELSVSPIQWDLFSVWFKPGRHYYLVGSGIYEKGILSDEKWANGPLDITRYGMSAIRGNGLNDVFSMGAFGEILHFNGVRWKSFINETGWFNGAYNSVVAKGNIIIATGGEGQQAKILMGKR